MSLAPDERFVAIEPAIRNNGTPVSLWQISIRNATGEYRHPTREEVAEFMQRPTKEREAELKKGLDDALGLLRSVLSIAIPGGNIVGDFSEEEARTRELTELLR